MVSFRSIRKRRLAWQSRLFPVAHASLPAGSGRVLVDLRDERGLRIATWGGAHGQRPAWDAWTSLLDLRRWDVVVDVGANYGEFAVPAARHFDDRVLAIEPNPCVAALLRGSLRQVSTSAVVACGAVGAAPSVAWLDQERGTGTARTLSGGRAGDLLVPVTTLDRLVSALPHLSAPGQVLIKLDVEGAEADVLRGSTRLLREPDVTVVLAEALHVGLETLRAALPGYTPYGLETTGPSLVPIGDREPPTGVSTRDVVFARGIDLTGAN